MPGDTAKRYGSRYGKKMRNKVSEVESSEKDSHQCPSCGSEKLVKESAGIWKCERCGEKISGGAWKPKTGAKKLVKRALRKAGEDE